MFIQLSHWVVYHKVVARHIPKWSAATSDACEVLAAEPWTAGDSTEVLDRVRLAKAGVDAAWGGGIPKKYKLDTN